MSDYRRLISYIYSYENGVKTRNSGFAKVEARDGECKISISLKITGVLKNEAEDDTLEAFMFTRKDGKVYKTNIGRIRIVNGNSLFRAQYDEQKIGSMQFPLLDIAGIFICDKSFLDRTGNGNIVYASEWDDTTVLVDEFLDENKVAVDVTEQNGSDTGSTADLVGSDKEDSDNTNNGYENSQSQNQYRNSIIENQQPQRQNNEIENSQPQRQNNEIENSQPQRQNNEIEKSQPQRQNNEIEKSQPQRQNNEIEKSQPQRQNNEIEKRKPQSQSNIAESASMQNWANKTEKGQLQHERNEADNPSLQSQSNISGISAVRINVMENNESNHQSVGSDTKSDMPVVELRAQNSNVSLQEKTETKEDIKTYQEQLQNLIMSPAHNSDRTGVASTDTAIRNNQKNSATVQGNNTGNIDAVRENIAGNTRATQGNNYGKQDYFTMLCNCYPNLKIEGLSDRCIKITPHDISYLPRRYWHLGNNSFLLHGFYHYRYILLCEEMPNINENDNTDRNGSLRNGNQRSSNQANSNAEKEIRYMICVPGIYQKREQTIARTYGFSVFKEIPQENVKNFGYWCFYL